MMGSFIKLNSKKIGFAYVFSAVSFLLFTAVILLVAYFKGYPPHGNLLAAILLTDIIVAPAFIICIARLAWQYKKFKQEQLFQKPPFDKLETIGFYKSFKNKETKWHFTDEIKEVIINGFKIHCNIIIERHTAVEFEVLDTSKQIDKHAYERLEKLFAAYNGYFKIDTIAKKYTMQQTKELTIEDIKKDLQQFTMMLKEEGFEANH
ncbi:MAG: hypothetical protein QM791_05350 [Ferruginibacter sp.]